MQTSYPVPGFRVLWRRQIYQFTVMRMVARRPLRLSATALAGALTTTSLPHDELLIQR